MTSVQVWSTFQAAGGTRLAVLTDLMALGDAAELDNSETLSFELPVERAAEIELRRVVRVETDDDVREWMVTDVNDAVGGSQNAMVNVSCRPAILVLAGVPVKYEMNGEWAYNLGAVELTAESILDLYAFDSLAEEGIEWIDIGVIDSAARISLAWDRWSVLDLVTAIAAQLESEVEFVRQPDGTYLINIVEERGADADQILLRTDKNLTDMRRSRRDGPLRTVVIPAGGVPDGGMETANIGWNLWQVTAVSGTLVTIADPAGEVTPVRFLNQLAGLWLQKANGSRTAITASSLAQVVTVADGSNIAVGDRITIVADSTGTRLDQLKNPAAVAQYGRILEPKLQDTALRGEPNLQRNGDARDWPTKPVVYGCRAAAQSFGTSVSLKELPASLFLPAGTVLITPGAFSVTTVGATTSGSGTVTLTVNTNATLSLDDGVSLTVHSMPAGWSSTDQSDGMLYRGASAGGVFVGQADGDWLSNAVVTIKGLPPGVVIHAGDMYVATAIIATAYVILKGGTVGGDGKVTIIRANPFSVPNDGPIEVRRCAMPAEGLLIPTGSSNAYVYYEPPAVLVDPGAGIMLPLWAHARYTMTTSVAITVPSYPGRLEVIALPSTSLGEVVAPTDETVPAAPDSMTKLLQRRIDIAAPTNVQLRFARPHVTSGVNTVTGTFRSTLHYMMLSVGIDPNVPYVEGSHANKLWQYGNRKLKELSADPSSVEASLLDLERLGVPFERIVLGGEVRLQNTKLGIDTTYRVVSIRWDRMDPAGTTVILSRRLPRLTRTMATRKPRIVVNINVEQDPDAQPTYKTVIATSDTPVDQSGATRATEDSAGNISIAPY
jgi:hypothetical protein